MERRRRVWWRPDRRSAEYVPFTAEDAATLDAFAGREPPRDRGAPMTTAADPEEPVERNPDYPPITDDDATIAAGAAAT